MITSEDLRRLCGDYRYKEEYIKFYLSENYDTVSNLLILKHRGRLDLLLDYYPYSLIKEGVLTYKQALSLVEEQIRTLTSYPIYSFLLKKILKVEDALKLTAVQIEILKTKNSVISECLERGILSSEELIGKIELLSHCWYTTQVEHAQFYLSKGWTRVENLLALPSKRLDLLLGQYISKLIATEILTYEQAISLPEEKIRILAGAPILGYLLKRLLNVEEALKINDRYIALLKYDTVLYCFEKGVLSLSDVFEKISLDTREGKPYISLKNPNSTLNIEGQEVSGEEFLNCAYEVIVTLRDPVIKQWLEEGKFVINELLNEGVQVRNMKTSTFTPDGSLHTEIYHENEFAVRLVKEGIRDQSLSPLQLLALNNTSYNNINFIDLPSGNNSARRFNDLNDGLRKCLEERIFTLKEFIVIPKKLSPEENLSMRTPEARNEIRYKLRSRLRPSLYDAITGAELIAKKSITAFTGIQNTHVSSIHKSVNESVLKLEELYQAKIITKGQDKILEEVKNYIENTLPSADISGDILKAALTFINGLLYKNIYKEPVQYIFFKRNDLYFADVLALFWEAIHDDKERMGDLNDAHIQLINALHEIQRTYNLDRGETSDKPDRPTCLPGAINKLIERLGGIHPAAEMVFKTPATAALKLRVVVKEVALEYLKANPKAVEGVKDEGAGDIWLEIKQKVTDRMFEEFGDLQEFLTDQLPNKNNEEFIQLIDQGIWVPITDEDLKKAGIACAQPSSLIEDVEVQAGTISSRVVLTP